MFRELGKGIWFYIHAFAGAVAGYVAATLPNVNSYDPHRSYFPAVAMVIGAIVGSALWLGQKYAKDEAD